MKTQSPSLASFIRQTDTLHKRLQALIKQYPEDALQPDEKIFNRLLTNDWRYLRNHSVALEKRYVDAAKWVDDFNRYHSDLRDFCVYRLGTPTKLNELPMYPQLRLSAERCVYYLELQFEVLRRWEGEATDSVGAERVVRLKADLRVLVDKRGIKTVEAEAGVNRDTILDFLNGKTKPQQKTLDKLELYAKPQKSHT